MLRLAGIDPGSITGVVVLDVPETRNLGGCRWVAGGAFRPSQAAGFGTEVLRDQDLYLRVRSFLAAHEVREAAIEVAAEAKSFFSNRGRFRQRGETAFRAGMYAMLAVLAALEVGATVTTYPAVSSKIRGPGWMGHSPRRVLVPRLMALLKSVGAPDELRVRDEQGELRYHHQGDALGVLMHHLGEQAVLRRVSA